MQYIVLKLMLLQIKYIYLYFIINIDHIFLIIYVKYVNMYLSMIKFKIGTVNGT